MFDRSEKFFIGHDGTKLFVQKWISHTAKKDSLGTILITHGTGEHSDCYHRLIEGMARSGWSFIAWDLRGHGRSDGVRGYAREFEDYVLDYRQFLDQCFQDKDVKGKPIVVLGHSKGGLIQTCGLLMKQDPEITAQVLSSPAFGVSMAVPLWKDVGAGFLNSLLPQLAIPNGITPEQLTRDPDVIREYEQDTLRHTKMSAGVYLGMKRKFDEVRERAGEIHLPTFMCISNHDPIVSTESALHFFDLVHSDLKRLKVIENGKHELFNDICRAEIYKALQDFLKTVIKKQDT